MVYRYYRLQSLTSIAAFEAAARHRSIQRAAAELNVTPGAVSRQNKALEEELGVPLFGRTPTGLTLSRRPRTPTDLRKRCRPLSFGHVPRDFFSRRRPRRR
jgi:hypothetical protein